MGIIKRLATALNWWNPLVYRICTKHTIVREEVADNYVLSEFSAHQYSECLTTMAEKICLISNLPSTAGMAGNYLNLEHRVKNILSKKRSVSIKTGFILKLSVITVFFGLALAVAGVQAESGTNKDISAPAPKKPAKTKIMGDYVITGTLPTAFPDRKGAIGEVILYKRRTAPPIAVEKIATDIGGNFKLTTPGKQFTNKTLKAKVVFKSKVYIPLEAYLTIRPGKPAKAKFRPLVLKKDAIHYYGECLDEFTNKPIPFMGMYSDSKGTEIGRADKNGHLDFYLKPRYGVSHLIPWYSSDKYVGSRRLLTNQPGTSAEVKIVVERGVKVRVKTVDKKGNPVPGVKVIWSGAGDGSGKTDKTGNVRLSGMASRMQPGIVRIEKSGYELNNEPGQLMAVMYTDKPLVLVLRKTDTSRSASEKTTAKSPTAEQRKAACVKKTLNEFTKEDMRELRMLCMQYRKCKNDTERKPLINAMIERYPTSSIVGSLLLKIAEKAKGKNQIELYQKVIDNYYNCYEDRGGLLGVLALYKLGTAFLKNGNEKKALGCFKKIKQDYEKSQDKGGFLGVMAKVDYQLEYTAAKQKELLDKKSYSSKARKEIQELFSSAIDKYNTSAGKASLDKLVEKYPGANATGMALLSWGGSSKGKDQIKYLKQAVKLSSDCYKYRVSVGALARYLLARVFISKGKQKEAEKLIKEIAADYPNSIDSDRQKIPELALKLETPDKYVIPQSDWQKLARLNSIIRYQKTTGPAGNGETEEKDKLTDALIKRAYLAKFKPINGFDPAIARQILARLRKRSKKLRSGSGKIGVASIFRTTVVNGMLEGTFVTTEPEIFKSELKKSPSFKLVSMTQATPENFIKHINSKQEANKEKWKKMGPKIVEIIPPNGAKNVDPNLKFIKIKFNQKMKRKVWAVVTLNPEKQIPIDRKIHYDKTGTTFIIPVKLEPNHEYLTSLNTAKFIGFFSKKGEPLAPYRYSFTTGSGK